MFSHSWLLPTSPLLPPPPLLPLLPLLPPLLPLLLAPPAAGVSLLPAAAAFRASHQRWGLSPLRLRSEPWGIGMSAFGSYCLLLLVLLLAPPAAGVGTPAAVCFAAV
jgi:hypothetical protein